MNGHGHGGGGEFDSGQYHSDDKLMSKNYDFQLMGRLLKYIRPYWFVFLVSLVVIMLLSIAELAGPRLIGLGIDEVDAEKVLSALRSHILLTLAAIYLGIEILKSIFTYITEYILAYLAQKIMFDLRMKVFSHLQNMSLSFFDKNPVGRLVTRTINDIHTMSDFFAMGLVTIFRDFFFIIVLISYMFWLNPQLALLALSVMPLLAILTFFIKSKMRLTFGEERRKIAAINGYLQENISGMRIVQLFNREPKHFKKFTRKC